MVDSSQILKITVYIQGEYLGAILSHVYDYRVATR